MAETARKNEVRRAQATAARLAAIQALYQIDMGAASLDQALAAATRNGAGAELDDGRRLDADPFVLTEIVQGVVERTGAVDAMITAALSPKWRLERLEHVLRALLRAGAFELLARPKVPARAVLNEYVDLAHAFYDKAEAGLVNAVLDRLARTLRPDEFAAEAPNPPEGTPDA
ncbi:MAG: transcription antitermination factor NusB [Alphaproteobacteria bacterium]